MPRMGDHMRVEGQDTIYLVYQGKVIGLEWVLDINDINVEAELEKLAVGHMVDHIELGFDPVGTRGSTVPKAAVHVYFITPAERDKVKPPAQ